MIQESTVRPPWYFQQEAGTGGLDQHPAFNPPTNPDSAGLVLADMGVISHAESSLTAMPPAGTMVRYRRISGATMILHRAGLPEPVAKVVTYPTIYNPHAENGEKPTHWSRRPNPRK